MNDPFFLGTTGRRFLRQSDLAKRAELEAQHPELVDLYRREASTPIRFSFSDSSRNITTLGRLTKYPKLAKVTAKAGEIERAMLNAKIAKAKAAEEKARNEREAAERDAQQDAKKCCLCSADNGGR
jgi:hypothetical protein